MVEADRVVQADVAAAATFADLGVRSETVEALRAAGIVRAFPIQELTLPLALRGTDIIGQARTGTGKTLAFGVPLVQAVTSPAEGASGRPQALVIVPTRELCSQVTADVNRAGAGRGLRVLAVYGGRAYEPQTSALASGVEVVIGTPGRLLDLAKQHTLDLSDVKVLVLDEADEMLDLGFLPDVERIVAFLPARRQTMLFSATMPGPVVALARRFMSRPVHVTAEQPDEGRTVPTTRQHVVRAHALDKIEVLARVLQARGRGLSMVFVRTRRTADRVAEDLAQRGFAAAAVHGDLGQGQREQALRAFRAGKVDVLVATDVAARGIDVGGVTHVVNYQCPEDEKVYLHRIGRTGRAGESGVALTFVDWDDLSRWALVNRALALPFDEPIETYSTSPHLYETLDIPTDAKGTLPVASRTRAGLAAEELEDLGETGRTRGRSRSRDRAGERERVGGRRSGSTDDTSAAVDAPAGTPRVRRRTRGGQAVAANAVGDDSRVVEFSSTPEFGSALEFSAVPTFSSAPELTPSPDVVNGAVGSVGSVDESDQAGGAAVFEATAAGDGTRRRRRRRGGRGRSGAGVRGAEAGDEAIAEHDDSPQAESA